MQDLFPSIIQTESCICEVWAIIKWLQVVDVILPGSLFQRPAPALNLSRMRKASLGISTASGS